MKFLLYFGVGGKKIMAQNRCCSATVTRVATCYWLKINTKPLRKHAWDGAVHPHMVSFEYEVNGQRYSGKRYFSWTIKPPVPGCCLTVYYDEANPARFALDPK